MTQARRRYPIYTHTGISPERLHQVHDAAFAWVQAELPFQLDADYSPAGDVENVAMFGSVAASHIGRQLYSYSSTALDKLALIRIFQTAGNSLDVRLQMLQAAGKAAALGHALSVMVGYAVEPHAPLGMHERRASNLFACSSPESNATAEYVRRHWIVEGVLQSPLWACLHRLDAVLPAPLTPGGAPREALSAAYVTTRETTRFFMDMLVDYAVSPIGADLVLPQPGVQTQLLLARTETAIEQWQAPAGAINTWRQTAASLPA
jgi:hypothetical protein